MRHVTAYLTAENPKYTILPLRADNARMYQLLHDAERFVLYPDRQIKMTQMVDRKTYYSERGVRISGITLPDAIQLARMYGQESIVVEEIGLINVNTLTYNPIVGKHFGEDAYNQNIFVLVEGMPAVSFEIDFETTKRLPLGRD
jgi:hypothetical protein